MLLTVKGLKRELAIFSVLSKGMSYILGFLQTFEKANHSKACYNFLHHLDGELIQGSELFTCVYYCKEYYHHAIN